jgi:hypothetical protein
MYQLILVILAISLTAALAMVSLNYLPGWQGTAGTVERQVSTSLALLEQGYDVATRSQNGIPPPVTTAADGGFAAAMIPVLRFTPYAPTGYQWVYGMRNVDGTQWGGLNYFCLVPVANSSGATEGVARGMARLKTKFSPDQLFLSSACGDSQDGPAISGAVPDLRLTFFVAYTPGVTR